MLFTVTKNSGKKPEGNSICRCARIDRHTLFSCFVISCWEQLKKLYCKNTLSSVALRFYLNHSKVIQRGFFVQHVVTLFWSIKSKEWAETCAGSQVMAMHENTLCEYLLWITEEEKSPLWLKRSSLRPGIFSRRLAIEFANPGWALMASLAPVDSGFLYCYVVLLVMTLDQIPSQTGTATFISTDDTKLFRRVKAWGLPDELQRRNI